MSVPTVCPKCSGNLVNIGGKPVCEKCFHTVEPGAAAAPSPAPAPTPAPAPSSAPAWSGPTEARPNPAPQQSQPAPHQPQYAQQPQPAPQQPQYAQQQQPAPQQPQYAQQPQPAPQQPQFPQQAQPAPPRPTGPVCPKCSGNLVDIGGKPVCEQCFHTVETGTGPSPAPTPAPRAPMPQQSQSGPGPGGAAAKPLNYAPQPTPSLNTPAQQGGSVSAGECPKCSGALMDIGGKPVCEQCFYVVDTPSSPARISSSSSPFASQAAQKLAPPPPTNCPKCSGKLVEAGGNLVCGDCYHVVEQPSATPARPSNNFTPRRTGTGEEEPMSPQMIGGIALILLLILMIIVLAIKH